MKTFIFLVAFAFIGFSESQRIVIEERAPRPVARPRAPAAEAGDYGPPKPYSFDVKNQDPEGNQQFHSETGDEYGNKRGTYGYQASNGVYRIVDYTANQEGYKASVRTNEPGVGKHANGDPADTKFEVEPPPAAALAEGETAYRKPAGAPVRPPVRPAGRPGGRGPGERIIIEEGGRRPTIVIEEGPRG
ncbi:serine/threonine-protein phosphatase 2A regulatory subunit pppA-like protein [Dinothrombium tinctorium]|uniref:Serine/threonine-protein phosphatase 2A regulatory subunit pppA-like protein n=1 Tax=Dinothrombium tinctorium TaxID=1965070 RepID=A0A3S3P955_9ACAR|nr:serine/threonine-protein phosphatase 2A regulatory subunit pppA-like protein [Dinothrombium tinctorium]